MLPELPEDLWYRIAQQLVQDGGLTAWDSGWERDERRAWGGLQARFTNAFLWRTMNTLMEQTWNAFKRDRFLYRPGAPVQHNLIIMTDYWLVERAVVEYVRHLVACGALSPLLRRFKCQRHSIPSNTYQEAKVKFLQFVQTQELRMQSQVLADLHPKLNFWWILLLERLARCRAVAAHPPTQKLLLATLRKRDFPNNPLLLHALPAFLRV